MIRKIFILAVVILFMAKRNDWGAEENKELNEKTKRSIEKSRAEIKAGKFYTHEQVKKNLGIK